MGVLNSNCPMAPDDALCAEACRHEGGLPARRGLDQQSRSECHEPGRTTRFLSRNDAGHLLRRARNVCRLASRLEVVLEGACRSRPRENRLVSILGGPKPDRIPIALVGSEEHLGAYDPFGRGQVGFDARVSPRRNTRDRRVLDLQWLAPQPKWLLAQAWRCRSPSRHPASAPRYPASARRSRGNRRLPRQRHALEPLGHRAQTDIDGSEVVVGFGQVRAHAQRLA